MTHLGHHDLVCSECGIRIGGCRCVEPGKQKIPAGLCKRCKKKDDGKKEKSDKK